MIMWLYFMGFSCGPDHSELKAHIYLKVGKVDIDKKCFYKSVRVNLWGITPVSINNKTPGQKNDE